MTLADEFLEPLPGQDDLLKREPFAVAAYRLVAGRLGDYRAAVESENPKCHRSIVAEVVVKQRGER